MKNPNSRKKALISVSNKKYLDKLAQFLKLQEFEVFSTGGTKKFLEQSGLITKDISEYTGFPEVLGGRVKTLHPHVHMSLLATESEEHQATLAQYKLSLFDLVVCNLYPFEQAAQSWLNSEKNGTRPEMGLELIEEIDIGGVTLLRAAAKNFQNVVLLSDPLDYENYIVQEGKISLAERRRFAAKAFRQTSFYDSLIASAFAQTLDEDNLPHEMTLPLRKVQGLRYGENPHQSAAWYQHPLQKGLQSSEQLQGKELSFNNILDLHGCLELMTKLEGPACVAVKHNNPCGVGTDPIPYQAMVKALTADPVSVFGGILTCNFLVDETIAHRLSEVFLECVLAPEFTAQALEVFKKKKNLRVLRRDLQFSSALQVKNVLGGFVVQSEDQAFQATGWDFLGGSPSASELADLKLAEKVCSQLKSNAIAIVENGMSLGLGMGQVNRVDAVLHAVERMKQHHPHFKNPVLASDAFFPFPDSIELIAKAGIRWVLQPGGSVKDAEVKAAAERLGVQMVFTGTRHFKH